MNTFHIEVKDLGPVKEAQFDASHFNLLCGKNNSGKSICMHTVFCFFKEWRKRIHIQANPDLVENILSGDRAKFDITNYVGKVNPAIQNEMPQFSKSIKSLLNKTSDKFDNCVVKIIMFEDYLLGMAKKVSTNVYLNLNDSYRMRMRKESQSNTVEMWIDDRGNGQYPSRGLVALSVNKMMDFLLIDQILPEPYLLTAERSGSMLYGDDLRSLSFFESQDFKEREIRAIKEVNNHYALPYVHELKNIWSLENKMSSMNDMLITDWDKKIRDRMLKGFSDYVSDGVYEEIDGSLYFRQNGLDESYRLNEVSTSSRSLAQIYYFIRRAVGGNFLLMIDEPELNLHPERQRSLIRLLSLMCGMSGIGIVISTHADIIIRELNTLMALGSAPKKYADIMEKYGYSEEELIRDGDIASGVVEHGVLHQLKTVNTRTGLVIPSFDKTIDKINAVQNEIISCE